MKSFTHLTENALHVTRRSSPLCLWPLLGLLVSCSAPSDSAKDAHTDATLEEAVPSDQRITLWNGRNLDGWNLFLNDTNVEPASTWSASSGVLRLDTESSGYIKTETTFSDYHLHIEWRWPETAPDNSNSGVLLHLHGPDVIWPLCFEAQLKNGNAGQVIGMGLDIPDAPTLNNRKRAPRLAEASEKPVGQWNTYEIYCRDDAIEVFVNGVRQNHVDKLPVSKGVIGLQMEGFPIEFRNLWLKAL